MHKSEPKYFLRSLSAMGCIVEVQDIVDALLYLAEARQTAERCCTSIEAPT
jgi:hypothetical protein